MRVLHAKSLAHATYLDGVAGAYRKPLEDLPNLEKAYNEGYKAFMEEAKLEVRGNRFNSLT